YLAVILDSYSRKVVGWKLDRALTSRLAADALESAIELRRPLPGVVHHSDRGVQYTSPEYIGILKLHGMIRSMSRPANPYDNANCRASSRRSSARKSTPTNTATSRICTVTSRSSSTATTTRNDCIPRSGTKHQRSSRL